MLHAACCLALQVVENVLAECGQDIDAAIRRLNQLKLNAEHGSATQQAAAQADTATAAADTPQRQEHAQHAAVAAAAAASGPQTADQWVDALVQEMATAKDIPDARSRAGKLLQAFEQFTTTRSKAEVGFICLLGGQCSSESCCTECLHKRGRPSEHPAPLFAQPALWGECCAGLY